MVHPLINYESNIYSKTGLFFVKKNSRKIFQTILVPSNLLLILQIANCTNCLFNIGIKYLGYFLADVYSFLVGVIYRNPEMSI